MLVVVPYRSIRRNDSLDIFRLALEDNVGDVRCNMLRKLKDIAMDY